MNFRRKKSKIPFFCLLFKTSLQLHLILRHISYTHKNIYFKLLYNIFLSTPIKSTIWCLIFGLLVHIQRIFILVFLYRLLWVGCFQSVPSFGQDSTYYLQNAEFFYVCKNINPGGLNYCWIRDECYSLELCLLRFFVMFLDIFLQLFIPWPLRYWCYWSPKTEIYKFWLL